MSLLVLLFQKHGGLGEAAAFVCECLGPDGQEE